MLRPVLGAHRLTQDVVRPESLCYSQLEPKRKRMEAVLVALPKEVYDRKQQHYKGENYQITFVDNIAYLWLVAQPTPPAITEFEVESDSVPGDLPVACCATQWDSQNNRPTYNETVMIDLLSVQRRPGRVRVRIRVSRGSIGTTQVGIGCIFAVAGKS